MNATSDAPARRRSLSSGAALLLGLLAIALAVLVLANEVRFQGCVARADRQVALAVQTKTPVQNVTECSRVPFAAG